MLVLDVNVLIYAFDVASPSHDLDFLEDVRNLPAFFAAEPGPGHWSLFTKLILQHQLQKASLTDGWLAALSLELGASVVTTDSGFSRFRGLSTINPLRAS